MAVIPITVQLWGDGLDDIVQYLQKQKLTAIDHSRHCTDRLFSNSSPPLYTRYVLASLMSFVSHYLIWLSFKLFFGFDFHQLGFAVIKHDIVLLKIEFPAIFSCKFKHVGPSGSIALASPTCYFPTNEALRTIFMPLWVASVASLMATFLNFCYLMALNIPLFRNVVLDWHFVNLRLKDKIIDTSKRLTLNEWVFYIRICDLLPQRTLQRFLVAVNSHLD